MSIRPVLYILLVLAIVPGCEKPVPPEIPVPTVTVTKPLVRDVSRYAEITGYSRASAVFEARARVQGYLRESPFKEGSDVEKDAILFEIEKEPFQAELNAAEAALASSQAQKKLSDADLARVQQLYDKKVATKAELEKAQAQVAVLEAQILADTARIEEAKIQLGYTTIKSEIDGMVGEIAVDPGNLVGTANTSLLATVQQYDPLHIYFDAPEGVLLLHLRELAEGIRESNEDMEIRVKFEGETGFPHKGTLNMVNNQIDPSTGTALLRGEIPNPDKRVLPGAYATIRIEAKASSFTDAVLIDERAIGTDLSGKYILLVGEGDKVEQRRVELGQRYHSFRHVVAMWNPSEPAPDLAVEDPKPIDPDFRYVLIGLQKARPGNPVKISEEVTLTYPEEKKTEDKDATSKIEEESDSPQDSSDSDTE